MADNYLEKKYEELQHGKTVVRRNTPSLDTLLKRVSESYDVDPGYIVKQAQLDALVRSAGIACGQCVFDIFETSPGLPAIVRISSPCGGFALGQAVLAVRLKAAELSLDTAVRIIPSMDDPKDLLQAEVSVFRKRSF